MSDEGSDMSQVAPLGRLEWGDVVGELAGATCVWQDLKGLHSGPVPEDAPLASHLWAWRGSQSWRFRVDGDTCVGAALNRDDGAASQGLAVLPRSTPDSSLSVLLGELAEDVRIVVVGEQSQAVFLFGSR